MILYFLDRTWNILGQASTHLPEGVQIFNDRKKEDLEAGVSSFECEIPYTFKTRENAEKLTAVGNYILRKHDNKDEFFTIIDSEESTKDRSIFLYAEDAGLDLINEVYGDYEADEAYPIAHYINKYVNDSGFVIGINEISNRTRKLVFEGESTATQRLASIANSFDCDLSFSFEIKGLKLINKYINIHAKRGKNEGVQLRLNKEIDNIITKKSISNLATALLCTGGTPEKGEEEDAPDPVPITLAGYSYDDGEFYVDGRHLKSRTALRKWSRYVWQDEPNKQQGYEGHIVKLFSYDTLSQQELCAHAVTELKKICDMEVNYEVDIAMLPEGAEVGDTVYIIDDEGDVYVETRILLLETSVANQTYKATLGEFLIKEGGISQKVQELAAQFKNEMKTNKAALEAAFLAEKIAKEASKTIENVKENVIFSAKEQFYASLSPTGLQGGSWSDTQPEWKQGNYIFRRTLITHGNNSASYTPDENGVCITGNDGSDGKDGEKGADGTAICAHCQTGESYAAKTADIINGSLTLKDGVCVSVVFRNGNTASNPTLNIGGTGAKPIKLNGSNLTSSAYYWTDGAAILFVYDGSNWNIADASALKKAEEASKTASNYISYDGANGLQVGNKSSGSWSGYRTQMTSTAFNILSQAGAVLASYGAKLIELGKNATDAVIKLCGGKGLIQYDSDEDYIEMTGKNVRVRGEDTSALYSYYYDGSNTVKKSVVNAKNNEIEMFVQESYNVDPDTMAGTGESSSFYLTPTEMSVYAYEILMQATQHLRLEAIDATGGNVEIAAPYGGVYLGGEEIYFNDKKLSAHVVESGTSGIWTYKKWSDGTAELFGKIPVSSLAISTALGGWYRSALVYTEGNHQYPFRFSAIPAVSVQFATSNGVGALVWLTTEGTVNLPPTLYLIRPTSASGASGYVDVCVKGKI